MSHPHRSLRALNDEWSSLRSTTREHVAAWSAAHAELRGCRDLDDLLAAIAADPDAVLRRLLALGATGDGLAHRVVLQTMLGKMVRMAASDPRHGFDDHLAELWLGIAAYPLANRPCRIAANLAWDVRKRLAGRPSATPVDPDRLTSIAAPPPDDEPSAERVLAEAERLGLIDRLTCATLRVVYAEGRSSARAAEVLGTSPEMVRWRCSRGLRRLSGHSRALSLV